MTTVTHATAATGTDSGDGKISKNAWNEDHTVDDDLKVAVLDLSSAQILALFATPIQVIAAPGAGKVLVPARSIAQLVYGTTTYVTGDTMVLRYAGDSNNVLNFGEFYAQAANRVSLAFYQAVPLSLPRTGFDNVALMVTTTASNPTTGDGTVRIIVRYTVEDLA